MKIRDVKKNQDSENEKMKKLTRLSQFYFPKKNRKNTSNLPMKQLKAFRPWSGSQSEDFD